MQKLSYITLREGTEKKAVVMLLHGVGSNEVNMAPLAAGADERLTVISVRAPLTMGPTAFAWFPVQFTVHGPVLDAAQAEQARRTLLGFIADYRREHGVQDVYLMGFSQGAIMALVTALSEPEQVQGAAALSGRFPVEFEAVVASPERVAATRFWVGHGVADEKLPIHLGRAVRDRLKLQGAQFEYNEFEAGHTVTPEMLVSAHAWLRGVARG